jgi:NhaP-type Na+/H+ and K+/H+ antiporter
MNTANELILLAGPLGLISVFAGVIGARFNAPTERAMIRAALWPSLVLATLGVVLTAGIVGGTNSWLSQNAGERVGLVSKTSSPRM